MTVRTSVYLDGDALLVAKIKYKAATDQEFNLSEFIRHCLNEYIGSDSDLSMKKQSREIVERFRKEQKKQQKLFEEEESAKVAVLQYQRDREAATRQAIQDFIRKIGPTRFSRMLPDHDPYGDQSEDLQKAINGISRVAGYDVDLPEIIRTYQELVA